MANNAVVSSESEQLILVDEKDQPIGFGSKAECHDGQGLLHRAFSLFVFNDKGELLLQQRADNKRLWGGYWSNSCCSHPRAGEEMADAVDRRLQQEMGMSAPLEFVYKFAYFAEFSEAGSEREFCWVYVGRSAESVNANPTEVENWRWISTADLEQEMRDHPERFTPWFKMEWERLTTEFSDLIEDLTRPVAA